jgi:site-specific DNA-methyltransferase (adenine-specific)
VSRIIQADNSAALTQLPIAFCRLIYIDPPFNTGALQRRRRVKSTLDPASPRTGFGGRRYRSESVASPEYADDYGDGYLDFLMPRIEASLRCLTADGSLLVHLDPREAHYVKVALDSLLGRHRFMNEIIWAYDFGGRPKTRWPAKHDTILWYAMDPKNYIFNHAAIDRIPYMAPRLVGPEKAARGKTPTDVWWQTIVPTNSREKTGYPTQKPLGLLRRIIAVHTNPGDTVLDYFAGSGTTGAAASELGREYVLIDQSPDAVRIMKKRLGVRPASKSKRPKG